MSHRRIIHISESVEDIPMSYFPISNSLQRFLRKVKVNVVGDLRQLLPDTIEQISHNKKKPFSELKQLICSIQDNDCKEIIFNQEDNFNGHESVVDNFALTEDLDEDEFNEISPIDNLSNLIEFINEFTSEIKGNDKEIFLGRLGATPDEKVIPMSQISGKYKMSPDFVAQTLTAFTNEISSSLGDDGNKVLNQIYCDCLEAVCPLTPSFLVYLTKNNYDLFLYPPAFYIRLIGRLSPKIPTLPEHKNKITKMGKGAIKISRQIILFLKEYHLPASLIEVYNRIRQSNLSVKDLDKLFFEAIQSVKFNLIETANPKEVFIELVEKV